MKKNLSRERVMEKSRNSHGKVMGKTGHFHRVPTARENRENRENGPKNSLSGKTQFIFKLDKSAKSVLCM